MFDIEGEDAAGVKSDVERFVLDYKDGNLYRMCKEEGSFDGQSTTMGTTTVASTAPPLLMTTIIDVTTTVPSTIPLTATISMVLSNSTTIAPMLETTTRPNDVANEINSSDVNNESVRLSSK